MLRKLSSPKLLALILTLLASGANATERTVTSPDGVQIHYLAEGSGPTALVFVHGWGCDATYWRDQMKAFAPEYSVVAVDLAGHGKSGSGRQDWTMAAFAGDVKAVADQEGLERVVLIGHSMGGAVIAEAALLMPKRVVGLVGVDNFQKLTLGLTDEQVAGFLAYFEADFANNVKCWVRQMFVADSDSALVEKISSDLAAMPPVVGLGAMENLLHWYDTRPATVLPQLPAPLHCINSDRNPTDETALKSVRPDYVLHLMNGGHFLAQEHPAVFNRTLREALAGLLKTSQ